MNDEFLQYAAAPIALKMAVSLGIGMLIGMERKWSNKEMGIRSFAMVALLGMLASVIGTNFVIASLAGVLLLVLLNNGRNILVDRTLEITTSVALIVTFILGVLVGLGHIFLPVAGSISVMMLLAWKAELNKFAGGLKPAEIRSAVLLGLIGFVIYPILPDRYIDPWQLFNPADAWFSVIAISGIGFLNYFLLRVFSTNGLYLGAIFGGLVNSTATLAETSTRVQEAGLTSKISTLCLLTTIAMFGRNLILLLIFSPLSITSTFLPIISMSIVSGLWIWKDYLQEKEHPITIPALKLASPISLKNVLSFGLLFVLIAIGGTLLTKLFGNYGIMATGFFGGFISSASTTAAAATMASHEKISAALAGSVTIVTSLTSALVSLPIVWKIVKDKSAVRKLTFQLITVLLIGIAVVMLDRYFEISEQIINFDPSMFQASLVPGSAL
jgi:uncharacterized membrane protein (DUF4010 family)